MRQRRLVIEILDQAPLPCGRQIERRHQCGKQSDVAHADRGRGKTIVRRRIEPEREHLGVRRRGVLAAEGFDAGLQEFAAALAAVTKHRTEITKAARLAGGGRGEIIARHRNGEVGAQAQFASLRIARQIHALADVLAGKVEERLRRLENRGRHARIARPLEGGDQRVRPRIGHGARRDDSCTRHGALATG